MIKKSITVPIGNISGKDALKLLEDLMKEYRSKVCVRCMSIFYGDGHYCISCDRENKINKILAE